MAFTAADIALVLTSIASLAAVLSPVISSSISSNASARQKELDIYAPELSQRVSAFMDAYAGLCHTSDQVDWEDAADFAIVSTNRYRSFFLAAHRLIPFVPDAAVQAEIQNLVSVIQTVGYYASEDTDGLFSALVVSLSPFCTPSSGSDRKKDISQKHKRRSSN